MSEPNSSSEPTPAVPPAPDAPPAPSFTYGTPSVPPAPATPPPAAAPLAPPQYGERLPGYENGPAYGTPAAPPAAAPGYATAPGSAAPGYAASGYATPYGQPPVKRRRTWDVILTVILLVVGLFGMIIGLFYAWILSDPLLFREAMASQGMNVSVDTRGAALIIGITHPVLYLAALGVSILLLVKNKVAFWVPLAAGVIAAIVFWATLMAALLSDPALLNSVTP